MCFVEWVEALQHHDLNRAGTSTNIFPSSWRRSPIILGDGEKDTNGSSSDELKTTDQVVVEVETRDGVQNLTHGNEFSFLRT